MPEPIKGSITLVDDPGTTKEFMFNPSTLTDEHSNNWVKTQVPHCSHPVHQFGVGGDRVISFSLWHCADRYYAQGGGRVSDDPGLDLSPWMQFWRSLLYPSGTLLNISTTNTVNSQKLTGGGSFSTIKPPSKVLFNYGPFWRDVLCIVTKANITASFFSPELDLVRAEMAITLEESPNILPIFANDVRGGGSISV